MADLSSILGAAGIGGAIGKAIVSLELETTKYKAELQAAEAQTVASTNASSKAFGNFGSFASTALLGVGAAAVAGAALSIKAAIDANEAHLKLQNTFANNAALADSSVAAFERQAEAIRALTGVDDEAIITGQALLGSMNRTGQEVMDLTPLIVDLASKYDIDLQAAFKAVGKAADGSTGALARYVGQIDAGKTPAETLANVTEALGKSAGFAAQQADSEPWRLLKSDLEEMAESVGQVLLPAFQALVEGIQTYVVPAIEALTQGIMDAFDPDTYTSIPIIGEAFKALGSGIEAVGLATQTSNDEIRRNGLPLLSEMKATADIAASGLINLSETFPEVASMAERGFKRTTDSVNKFAHMTGDDLQKWSDDTKESFESYVINLDKVNEATDFTKKDLRDSFQAMLQHARDLNSAMRTISREDWINKDFEKFLAEQPDKLILFADSNETAQRKMQEQWKTSGDILKTRINDHLDDMTGILDALDKSETKHDVTIRYHYEGFDPSKPGMGGQRP